MPRPRFYTPTTFCIDCGDLIFSWKATRCKPCNVLRKKQRDKEASLRKKLKRKQRYKVNHQRKIKPPVFPGLDYHCQVQSTDGKFYIITFKGVWTWVKKVCRKCNSTDEVVKGKWAPIYSTADIYGNEIKPVLLCLGCYDSECRLIAS